MLNQALSMQRFANAMEASVRSRDRKDEGMVVIRSPDGIANHWIAPKLPAFLSAHPKIQVTLDCGTLTADMEMKPDITITADKTDAVIGDHIDALAVFHYVILASPAYLETYGAPQSLASAAGDHRTLKHIAQKHQREAWGPKGAAIEALASFSVVSNSSSAIIAAVLGGAGICTAPSLYCHLYPELRIVGPETAFPIQLWAVVHKAAQNAARVERVSRWLHSIFDTKQNPWFRDEFVPPSKFAEALEALERRLAPDTLSSAPRPARRRS
jgi:DNA-binding transcriptional LysR family regulator